jgi:amino acid adenylation domain-containing protein
MRDTENYLIDLIEQQGVLHPDQPAVISKAGQISYSDLLFRLNSVAAWLVERGVARETPVGVCADRSLPWVVGALGVLRAGAIYVPIDPMSPLLRKIRILWEAGVRLMLTEPHLPAALPESVELVMLDVDRPSGNLRRPTPQIISGQAAYSIHTSGSTGTPKNVIVSHDSVRNYASVLSRELMLTVEDRYLHTASLAFSASIRQLVAPLVCGATTVIAAREEIKDPTSLILRMLDTGVTVFDTVPSYLGRWLEAVWQSPRDWRDRLGDKLRLVLTTGESLPASAVHSLRRLFPQVRILNLYGQTETTGTVAIHESESATVDPIPIGRILPPCHFYVLNEHQERSDEGELYVSGPALARCYQGQPDLTACRFLPDPFCGISGSRMYRTGDHVRSLNNGLLEFKGRQDDQLKVHGVRIELSEINATLLQHPCIEEAATVLRPLRSQSLSLASFVVARPGRSCPAGDALREFVAAALPEIMVPELVVIVNDLPRTTAGKVDRPALIAADVSTSVPKTSAIAPRTPIEQLVAKCWEDVLKVTGIGIDDEFFRLGGDSMQAMEMVLRVQALLTVRLPLTALFFQDPTLEAFAKSIEASIPTAV